MQQDPVANLPEAAGAGEGEGGGEGGGVVGGAGEGGDRLAADCLTIWQSELAALAADPELGELRAALEALRPDPALRR